MAEGSAVLMTNWRTGEQMPPSQAIGTASISNDQLAGPILSLIGTASITNAQLAGPIISLIGAASVANSQLAGPIVSLIGTASITNAQLATPPIVSVISSGAIAATTTNVDFDLGTYDMVEIDLMALEPSNDAANLNAFFSQDGGSNYLAGAADYGWGFVAAGGAASDASDSRIAVGSGIGNAAGERGSVTVRIFRPSAAAFAKTMTWFGGSVTSAGAFVENQGWGMLIANTDAITNVRFAFSAGTFDAGYYAARGYSFT